MNGYSYASPAAHALNNEARLERIIGEFRAGYDLLETIGKAVTYFGSARVTENEETYVEARATSRMLSELGFTTVTGGGPGIMEAANRGAVDAGGRSVGFNIMLPHEQRNKYVAESVSFYYLFARKVMLASAGHAYIFFPGGFGTLDEFFEISTLIHTHKLHDDIPVVLVGRDYWEPLVAHLKKVVVERYHGFNAEDFRMWTVVDSADAAVKIIKQNALPARLYASYHGEKK